MRYSRRQTTIVCIFGYSRMTLTCTPWPWWVDLDLARYAAELPACWKWSFRVKAHTRLNNHTAFAGAKNYFSKALSVDYQPRYNTPCLHSMQYDVPSGCLVKCVQRLGWALSITFRFKSVADERYLWLFWLLLLDCVSGVFLVLCKTVLQPFTSLYLDAYVFLCSLVFHCMHVVLL